MTKLLGTSGDDILIGTDTDELLLGGNGNDLLDGRLGCDVMDGGFGSDTVTYDFLNSSINANLETGLVSFPGTATHTETLISIENLIGSRNNDVIVGSIINNTLWGGEGNDSLSSGLGDDLLFGGAGDDILDGGLGLDSMDGGEGTDTVTYSFFTGELAANLETGLVSFPGSSNRTETLTSIENLIGSRGNNTIIGSAVNNVLSGDDGHDVISGGNGDDVLNGGNGNDLLDGGFGFDTIDGGAGVDTVTYDFFDGGLEADLQTGTVTLTGSATPADALSNIENLTGSRGNDRLWGSAENNVLSGNSGDDVLDGRAGLDTLLGGLGDDTYILNDADQITEAANAGTDTVIASFNYGLGANVENLTLAGAANLNGSGNELDNEIRGNAGHNVLDGGSGADMLRGRAGDDTYLVDNVSDQVIEAASEGVDTVIASVNFTLRDQVNNLILSGRDSLNGTGNSQNNILTGNAGDNQLDGRAGNDLLVGLLGDDVLSGGVGADRFVLNRAREGVDQVVDFSQQQGDRVVVTADAFPGLSIGRLGRDQFVAAATAQDAEDRFVYRRQTGELFYDADGRGGVGQVKIATFENNSMLAAADILVVGSF
jgi:Ca2+-binding RTX toxin-like protein